MTRPTFAAGLCLLVLTSFAPVTAGDSEQPLLEELLQRPILDPQLPLLEVQDYTECRVLPMPAVASVKDWERYAEHMRQQTLQNVVFRGEAARWRDAETKVEWLDTLPGGKGYHIRKLRYEALPGLWIPALLYEPDMLEGKVPVVLNVNGHDRSDGKAAGYKQIRCINQAKRGMLALNVEWLGMGQLNTPGFVHYRMNQIDLCGTSGVATHYLSMKRGIDVLLAHEHADPHRVAVAGLSGGGWQTIFISSLDSRVTLSNPVAGYSSFLTRARHLSDLGDSEQTPVDLGTVTDYAQLTALRAPRPTLLTFNVKDNCCFRADHALPPLVAAAGPIFDLYGQRPALRSHVNHDPGTHNFELDNRQHLYRMFGDFFYPGDAGFDPKEIPCQDELKSKEELQVDVPEDNADFHTLALELSRDLPHDAELPSPRSPLPQGEGPGVRAEAQQWQTEHRKLLAEVVRAKQYDVQAVEVDRKPFDGGTAVFWWYRVGGVWTVPAVELIPPTAQSPPVATGGTLSTVILVTDEGRKSVAQQAGELLKSGQRVLAVDPFYFGESKIAERDFLFALLVSAVGDRPLGLQASQLSAIARQLKAQRPKEPVHLLSVGPRSSLIALVAAALEPKAIDAVELCGSFGSLKEIIEGNQTAREAPELFCFGLLEHFDVEQLTALTAPRPVAFTKPSDRVKQELQGLKEWYHAFDVEFDPLEE